MKLIKDFKKNGFVVKRINKRVVIAILHTANCEDIVSVLADGKVVESEYIKEQSFIQEKNEKLLEERVKGLIDKWKKFPSEKGALHSLLDSFKVEG